MIKNILIVEDEKSLQMALKKKLTGEGWKIFQAGNGQEGLDLLGKEKIDLILLDILMPVMDGVQMVKMMKKYRDYDKIKILVLTNLTEYESADKFLRTRSSGYLVKSNYSLDEIIEKIKSLN